MSILQTKAVLNSIFTASIWIVLSAQLPEYIGLAIFSGIFGGLSRWAAEKSRVWPEGISTVFLGATAATFLWPVGHGFLGWAVDSFEVSVLDIEPAASVMLGAYVTGLGGVTIIGGIVDLLKKKFGEDDEDG